jgi:hypothetical protein
MPFQEGVVLLCPRDVGEKAVAFFRYGQEHEVAILIRPGGCATVSNGRLAWQADWKAISLLLRLTR